MQNLLIKMKKCYHNVSEKVEKFMNSFLMVIVILITTIFSLFNLDVKILTFDVSYDQTFIFLNEVIFCILSSEFLCSILFEKNYNGSFFFYLDFVEVLSMIPDTQFIMLVLIPNYNSSSSLSTASSLIQSGSASQAGAK